MGSKILYLHITFNHCSTHLVLCLFILFTYSHPYKHIFRRRWIAKWSKVSEILLLCMHMWMDVAARKQRQQQQKKQRKKKKKKKWKYGRTLSMPDSFFSFFFLHFCVFVYTIHMRTKAFVHLFTISPFCFIDNLIFFRSMWCLSVCIVFFMHIIWCSMSFARVGMRCWMFRRHGKCNKYTIIVWKLLDVHAMPSSQVVIVILKFFGINFLKQKFFHKSKVCHRCRPEYFGMLATWDLVHSSTFANNWIKYR